jgi:hypothetical protein
MILNYIVAIDFIQLKQTLNWKQKELWLKFGSCRMEPFLTQCANISSAISLYIYIFMYIYLFTLLLLSGA